MEILNKFIGVLLGVFGLAVFYLDYLIFKGMSAIGDWLAELIGASASVGFGFTVIMCVLLLSVFTFITIVGCFLVLAGVYKFLD